MTVQEAIQVAEALLPGEPSCEGEEDPRWQAIISVAEHIEDHPDEVWEFAARWGAHEQDDVRGAIATCLLEHLLEHHFETVFARVEELVREDAHFADTLARCWRFGLSEQQQNAERWMALLADAHARHSQ